MRHDTCASWRSAARGCVFVAAIAAMGVAQAQITLSKFPPESGRDAWRWLAVDCGV